MNPRESPKCPYLMLTSLQTAIGKVDEILGPINQVYFTIKCQEGIQATSFKSGDKFYIGGDKLLPLEKFLPVSSHTLSSTAYPVNFGILTLRIPNLPTFRAYVLS